MLLCENVKPCSLLSSCRPIHSYIEFELLFTLFDDFLGGFIQVLLCLTLKTILFLLNDAGLIFPCSERLCTGTSCQLSLTSLPGDL